MGLLLVLLFLLSRVTTVTAVAGCRSDKDKDDRPRENCTAAGFSDVPAGFEPSTKVLLFPSNLFSSLSWSSFQIFPEIYEIDLTGNKVPEVTASVSPILPSLSVLRLGSNRLTSLSDGSFSACPGLTELYLDKNTIDSLSDHTFSGLSKLEILELSSNRIKVLPELLLHPLLAIETLYLENNKIKVMPDNWFIQKEDVPYLYLSANLWACSCSLGYLRRYIDDYELNIYVRDGPVININAESVVCDSPQRYKGTPLMSLEESDLCSPATESGPSGDFDPPMFTKTLYKSATAAATIPATTAMSLPSTAPPTTPLPTTTPSAAPPMTPDPPSTPASVELHTEYHRVVTWSWYRTFTSVIEWSDRSWVEVRGELPLVGSHVLATHPSLPTVRPSTESPASMTSATPTTLVGTTKSVPSTVTSTTPKLPVVTTTGATETPIKSIPSRGKMRAARGAGVFCFWLFAGYLLLCVASAACVMATLARLVVWYRRVYEPLRVTLAKRGGGQAVGLVTYSSREEKEVVGGGGVMALYRSVMFIHREAGEAVQREDGGKEGEGGEGGGKERLLVTLEPTAGGGATRGEEGERGVYRKTLYRLLSKEEEIEGWRDVMEECRVSVEDGGMDRERSAGGVSRKRYSVILREERAEAGGGREELDWVVGGWEVKGEGGGEEPRSSWGEWLAHYLPSMPWGVTTPPEGEAAQ